MSRKHGLTRRGFLRGGAVVAAVGVAAGSSVTRSALASPKAGRFATMIDLTKCDGCKGETLPLCVEACRKKNLSRYPEPKEPIRDLWPQKTHDDWSKKRDVIDSLTPYNWITVQRVQVAGQELFLPRRCMHCDNPPCANLCPFGALNKFEDGAVVINPGLCLGGAKCKAVCPWKIPQRQSGVGLYLKLQPLPAGGGVMYKCDLCHDLIQAGGIPECVEACRRRRGEASPLAFGQRDEIRKLAHQRASQINGFIYGETENGGTATLYVSPIRFEEIDSAISASRGGPHMGPVPPSMARVTGWAKGFLAAPLAAAAAAIGLVMLGKAKGNGEG
ncbi:MAG: 4Fe-4S dicluster domain-containing protein [Thermodesulfobacteriota bacterium]